MVKLKFKPFKVDQALSCAHAYVSCACVHVCAYKCMCVQKLLPYTQPGCLSFVKLCSDECANAAFKGKKSYFSKTKSYITKKKKKKKSLNPQNVGLKHIKLLLLLLGNILDQDSPKLSAVEICHGH